MTFGNFEDFGFTAVTEDELEAVQQAQNTIQNLDASAGAVEERLDALYNAILPLLSNLKLSPEKPYIHWPNRIDKVEQFEEHITKIYKGS